MNIEEREGTYVDDGRRESCVNLSRANNKARGDEEYILKAEKWEEGTKG